MRSHNHPHPLLYDYTRGWADSATELYPGSVFFAPKCPPKFPAILHNPTTTPLHTTTRPPHHYSPYSTTTPILRPHPNTTPHSPYSPYSDHSPHNQTQTTTRPLTPISPLLSPISPNSPIKATRAPTSDRLPH